MAEPEDQLRETFESHENLSPNLGAVYNGTQELFHKYRRRRRGAQIAGGTALVAAVLVTGANLPAGLLPGADVPGPGIATVPSAPTMPTSLTQAELAKDLDAYDRAGYGYDEAVQLAAIWHTSVDLGAVKAEAGSLLLAGQILPVSPQPHPADTSTPEPGVERALDAFAASGYTYDDAVKLARLWKLSDPSDAKVAAGRKLEAGQGLPFPAR